MMESWGTGTALLVEKRAEVADGETSSMIPMRIVQLYRIFSHLLVSAFSCWEIPEEYVFSGYNH